MRMQARMDGWTDGGRTDDGFVYLWVQIFMDVLCMHASMYTCMHLHVCMYVCMHVCMYMYVCMHACMQAPI